MEFNPQSTLTSIETGVYQLSGLFVAYSLSVVGAVLLTIIGYISAGLVERWVFSALGQVRGFDLTLRSFFSRLARYAVLALVLIMVLGQFGVQTASIVAAVGAIGLAIGLALQGTLQNIAAGIMLLVLRPLRVGEYVEVGPIAGTVEEIGLFATQLRAPDGIYILSPNSLLWNQPVKNFDRNRVRRTDLVVNLKHEEDMGLALDTLREIAAAEERVVQQPPPAVFIGEIGPSTEAATLRYWTAAKDVFTTKTAINSRIRAAFAEKGISIAA